jgi:hypothetical protein
VRRVSVRWRRIAAAGLVVLASCSRSSGAEQVPASAPATDPAGIATEPTTTDGPTTTASRPPEATTTVPADETIALAEGSNGPDVVTLQRMLNHVLDLDLVPDGSFGPDTTAAVERFQDAEALPVTGLVDGATWARLVALDGGRATAVPTWPVSSLGNGGRDGCQVALVGDSLLAGQPGLHEQALRGVGCAAVADGDGGRTMTTGWLCEVYRADGTRSLELLAGPERGNETCAPSGLELLDLWRAADALGDLVVMALGTNDAGMLDEGAWISRWERVMSRAEGVPVLFVTTAARAGTSQVAAQDAYSAALRRWCDREPRCRLADWALTATAADPASYVDAVHLGSDAVRSRAEFIAAAAIALFTGTPVSDPVPLPTIVTVPTPTTSTTSTSTTSTTTTSTTTTSTSTTSTSTTSTSTTTTAP